MEKEEKKVIQKLVIEVAITEHSLNIDLVRNDLYKDNEKLFLHLKRELSFFY
mgnify:CR=1 FL=1